MKPKDILSDFYGAHTLKQIHGWLDDLLRVALTSDNDLYETPEERYWIAEVVTQLHGVIDAGYEFAREKLPSE